MKVDGLHRKGRTPSLQVDLRLAEEDAEECRVELSGLIGREEEGQKVSLHYCEALFSAMEAS